MEVLESADGRIVAVLGPSGERYDRKEGNGKGEEARGEAREVKGEAGQLPPCLLALHCTRLEWLAAPVARTAQDYTSVRESVATGRLLDGSGLSAAAAEIRDVRPHAFVPAAGLALAGSLVSRPRRRGRTEEQA